MCVYGNHIETQKAIKTEEQPILRLTGTNMTLTALLQHLLISLSKRQKTTTSTSNLIKLFSLNLHLFLYLPSIHVRWHSFPIYINK